MKSFFKYCLFLIIALVFLRIILGISLLPPSRHYRMTPQVLPPLYLGLDNGFWQVWALGEPAEIQTDSPQVLKKYQQLFDLHQSDPLKLQAWYTSEYKKSNWQAFSHFKGLEYSLPNSGHPKEWQAFLELNIKKINKFIQQYPHYLKRYQLLLRSTFIRDISFPQHNISPSQLNIIHLAYIFCAQQVEKAFSGNWHNAVNNLLNQIDTFKKIIPFTRTISLNICSKAILMQSLTTLSAIMNHPQFPHTLYDMILKELSPSITYDDFTSANALMGQYFQDCRNLEEELNEAKQDGWLARIALFFTYDKNRAYYSVFKNTNQLIEYEKSPPFQHQKSIQDEQNNRWSSPFKLFNMAFIYGMHGLFTELTHHLSIYTMSYKLKAYYDMTLISAELHTRYGSGKRVMDMLFALNHYKNPDPYSGKGYGWDDHESIIYSHLLDEVKTHKQGRKRRKESEKSRGLEDKGQVKIPIIVTDKRNKTPKYFLYFTDKQRPKRGANDQK